MIEQRLGDVLDESLAPRVAPRLPHARRGRWHRRVDKFDDYVTLRSVKIVNIHEAKTHLSRRIEEALGGEEIIIARGNEPVVRLVLVESARPQRTLGWAKGQIRIAEDFDAPLDDFAEYR